MKEIISYLIFWTKLFIVISSTLFSELMNSMRGGKNISNSSNLSRKRIMYTIATNVGINHAQPDVALIVKDNVKKEDIKFVPGDRVKISAHVQYSKQENNEETEYLKTLVIDEMETADSTEQDVFDLDEVGQEDVNKGMFVGRVVHMFDVPKKDNLKIVTLSIRSQGFLNYVDIFAFDEFADMLKDVKNDDYLAVIAEVRTRKSLNDRMNLSNKLQNIVCIKMKKVPADNIEK